MTKPKAPPEPTPDERLLELAQSIGTFPTWYGVRYKLMEIGEILEAQALKRWPREGGNEDERRAYILGGLVAMDKAYGWDRLGMTQEREESIYWQFAYLITRF